METQKLKTVTHSSSRIRTYSIFRILRILVIKI